MIEVTTTPAGVKFFIVLSKITHITRTGGVTRIYLDGGAYVECVDTIESIAKAWKDAQ